VTERYDHIPEPPRELRLAAAFVEFADARPQDVLCALTRRCVELLDVTTAHAMVVDPHGRPRPAASSDRRARWLAETEGHCKEGPCLDCCRLAAPVTCPDLRRAAAGGRWPRFAARVGDGGVGSVCAVPLRRRGRTLGALALFRTAHSALPDLDTALAGTLAEAAAIGLTRQRALADSERLAGQLQRALDSRVVVEQAKGVLAERWGVHPDIAFTTLRGCARSRGARLADLARRVVDHTVDPETLRDPPP
jgi:GAF domain-containing protein